MRSWPGRIGTVSKNGSHWGDADSSCNEQHVLAGPSRGTHYAVWALGDHPRADGEVPELGDTTPRWASPAKRRMQTCQAKVRSTTRRGATRGCDVERIPNDSTEQNRIGYWYRDLDDWRDPTEDYTRRQQ